MAKNRRTIITELITAFGQSSEIEYTSEQLWSIFESCVDNGLIKKLSKPRESKASDGSSEQKSRGKTGYQHFMTCFSDPIPDGVNKRTHKTEIWKHLTEEQKDDWRKSLPR